MASLLRPSALSSDGGYATVSAITLCAAISILCAAMLGVASSQKQQSQRALFRLQQQEAINTAVMRFSTQVIRAQGDTTLVGEEVVAVPGGQMTVELRAEHEGRKWPLSAVTDVEEVHIAAHVRLDKAELTARIGTGVNPKDDCVRRLFSAYGANDPKKDFPTGVSAIAMAGGHDGQLWRIRAVTGGRVQERLVRFLGDPDHLFAVVSQEDLALGEMPTCVQMINRP